MLSPKRRDPIQISNEPADRTTQRRIPVLKSFDARAEKREPLPVNVYLASLAEPRARERTITEDVSPHGVRVLTKRYWELDEVPLVTPLIGDYPRHARVVYCDPRPGGGYYVGIEFAGPSFHWCV